jgi:hypothetical protein
LRFRLIVGLLVIGGLIAASGGSHGVRAETIVAHGVNISNTQGNSWNISDVGFDAAGNVIITWSDGASGGDVYASHSRDGGATFAPSVKISSDPARPGSVAPWISAGGAGAAWISGQGDPSLLYASFSNVTGTWGSPIVVDTGLTTDVIPRIVGTPDGSDIDLIYGKPAQGGSTQIFAALSPDGGVSFGARHALAILRPGAQPALIRNGAGSWATVVEGDGSIGVFKRDAGTFPWNPLTPIQAGARRAWMFQRQNVPGVYWETEVLPVSIFLEYLNAPNNPIQLSGQQSASDPSVATFGNVVDAAWLETDSITHNSVVVNAIAPGGVNFGSPLTVSPSDVGAGPPKTVLAGDTATILYDKLGNSTTKSQIVQIKVTDPLPHVIVIPDEDEPDFVFALFQIGSGGPSELKSQASVAAASGAVPLHPVVLWSAPPAGDSNNDIFIAPVGPSGDGNCDGQVDARDALSVIGAAAGLAATAACLGLTNVDCQGNAADAADAVAILAYSAGVPKALPSGCPAIGA